MGVPGQVQGDARLSVMIVDAKTGQPTAARVRITDEKGQPVGLGIPFTTPLGAPGAGEARLAVPGSVIGLPAEAIAIMYGQRDSAHGYGFQPNGAFYAKGNFNAPMPAGKFTVTLEKGYEFVRESDDILLKPGEHVTRRYALRRWIDMPERGWFSADDHIHMKRSRLENPLLLDWIAAEDVHVGVFLEVGDFWTTSFAQYAHGEKGAYGHGHRLLVSGQEEPRTRELGHTVSIGASQFVRFRNDYFLYDLVFDRVRQLGGIAGYAHKGVTFNGHRGITLDALTEKIDFLELIQFCGPGPLATEHYYLVLDLGHKLTALGGSDFPWCGRGASEGVVPVGPRIGDARFYTYTGGELSYARWMDAIKAGHTFGTTGPMLEFTVNGALPGVSLDVKPGARLKISAKAFGHQAQIPLQSLQIIGHGKVLAETRAGKPGQTAEQLSVELDLAVEHGIWLAARTDAGPSQQAHTTPVYVTVNGDGFHNRAELAERIELARQHLNEIRGVLHPRADRPRRVGPNVEPAPWEYAGGSEKLERRIAEAEKRLEELRRSQSPD